MKLKELKLPQKLLRITLAYFTLLMWSIVFLAYLGDSSTQSRSGAIALAALTTITALYNTRFDPNRCLPCAAMEGCRIDE